jgi:hypothetical protein
MEGTGLCALPVPSGLADETIAATAPHELRTGGANSMSACGWLAALSTPEPLILGPLFRLVADRCDDLALSRSRTLVVCGRLALSVRH